MRSKSTATTHSATATLDAVQPPLGIDGTASDLRILVADGNDRSREARRAQLTAAGFRVLVARTGFEAIVKATCHVPNLILLDDALSGIDSTDTGRLLTTCPVTSHIPVVRLLPGRRVPQRAILRVRRVAV